MATTARAIKTARRFELGCSVRHLRTRQIPELTQADLARLIGKPSSKIAAFERGEATIKRDELQALLPALKPTSEQEVDLLWLHSEADRRSEWVRKAGFAPGFRFMADIERNAGVLRDAALNVIPGVLESDTHIESMFASSAAYNASALLAQNPEPYRRDRNPEKELAQKISARKERAKLLLAPDAPEYRAVLHESCFHNTLGCPPEVMAEAITHVIDLSRLPRVTIQVLPFTAPVFMQSAFVLARLPSRIAGPLEIAYTEQYNRYHYSDDPEDLENYDSTWAYLTTAAADPDRSRDMMVKLRDGYRQAK